MNREMDRDTLLYKICPMHRVNDCCNGTKDYQCYDCAQLMGKWLDEYDKQIRTEAIDDFVNALDEVKVCEVYDCVSFYEIEHIAEQLKS